ncbi:hypothetical protein FBUS_05038 [Fasciolopsis buskii]|uniref:Uncharacterized protein n=1 Tax=Fasciolopsis buskii TaxID=27845 RepID=A0A8E0RN17_9TREM|nr:hypothetical protein FBUS_05038 [Fasciolopsis buski]
MDIIRKPAHASDLATVVVEAMLIDSRR